MNKELILKYKAEFDHWLNGGKILMHYYNNWIPVTLSTKWDFFISDLDKMGSFGYIINDEYVEFRKALAEGKIIQFHNNELDFTDIWHDYTDTDNFVSHCKYRIKPDEPKFKVGDLVRDKVNGKVVQLTEHFHPGGIELWKPKPEEYCYMAYAKGLLLAKVECIQDDIVYFNSGYREYINKCIPFIGELPTFLKEQ